MNAGTTIDATIASNAKAINAWAGMAASGLAMGSLTIDAIKEGLIARFPKAETVKDCGSTINGRFYALKRCLNDTAATARLIAGEALNTVAGQTAPVQEQAKGKRGGKGGSKATPRPAGAGIGWMDAVVALNGWLSTATGDVELAKAMAASGELSAVIAKIGGLSAMVERHAKAETANAKRNAKGKAATAKEIATAKAADAKRAKEIAAAKAADAKRVAKIVRAKRKGTPVVTVAAGPNKPKAKLAPATLRRAA